MLISEQFASKYVNADDLRGREVEVTIADVAQATLNNGDKKAPVLMFKGKEKGLVLNKTNALNLSEKLGDDTDKWIGAKIILFPDRTQYQGRMVDAVRVRVSQAPVKADGDKDDPIPF
jgi:hypothetical protein